MKIVNRILGLIAALAMIVILLITSFEIAAYSNFDWYLREYSKYEVFDDLEMEAEEVMHVTKEMMAYLRGNREDLVVETIVDGNAREFFNDREKGHMVDVQNLFLGGLDLRLGAGAVLIGALIVIVFTKADWKKLLPQSFLIGVAGFISLLGIFACLIAKDFHKYFFLCFAFRRIPNENSDSDTDDRGRKRCNCAFDDAGILRKICSDPGSP